MDIRRLLPIFVQAKGYYLLPALAVVLVSIRYVLSRESVARSLGARRATAARRGLLAVLAATAGFSCLVWVNFFNYHYGGFLNAYEFFHYYMGSKYAAEIGYFDIYDATLLADAQTGRLFDPPDGLVSDLRTYGYKDLRQALADPERCRSRFSDARWDEWVKDVSFFKQRLGRARWNELLRDKGYNATPAWTLAVGGALSRRVPTDDPAAMTALALLDVALLAAAVGCVAWVFGAWPALLAVVFIASSYLMAHVHMKGAFLRTDFVVALVVAMCALAKGRHGIAGALVGYSTLTRIFPAIFLFGPAVKLLQDLVPVGAAALDRLRGRVPRRGRLLAIAVALAALHLAAATIALAAGWAAIGDGLRELVVERFAPWGVLFPALLVPATLATGVVTLAAWGLRTGLLDAKHARFFGAFALVVAALAAASAAFSPPGAGWVDFGRKIALHRTTYNHWNIGVTSVVIAEFDPPGPRDRAIELRPPGARSWLGSIYFRPKAVDEKAGVIHLIQALAMAVAWLAALRLREPEAFAFGFVPTFFLTAPTYYYYIILLLPFLYFGKNLDRTGGTLGVAYLFVFGALGFAFYFRWDQYFATYYANSVLALFLTIVMAATAFTDLGRPRGLP